MSNLINFNLFSEHSWWKELLYYEDLDVHDVSELQKGQSQGFFPDILQKVTMVSLVSYKKWTVFFQLLCPFHTHSLSLLTYFKFFNCLEVMKLTCDPGATKRAVARCTAFVASYTWDVWLLIPIVNFSEFSEFSSIVPMEKIFNIEVKIILLTLSLKHYLS